MNIIENAVVDFISKWWNTFLLVFIVSCMAFGVLSLITGYALLLLILLIEIISQLRRIAHTLDTAPKQ